jgi:hypothetical protein
MASSNANASLLATLRSELGAAAEYRGASSREALRFRISLDPTMTNLAKGLSTGNSARDDLRMFDSEKGISALLIFHHSFPSNDPQCKTLARNAASLLGRCRTSPPRLHRAMADGYDPPVIGHESSIVLRAALVAANRPSLENLMSLRHLLDCLAAAIDRLIHQSARDYQSDIRKTQRLNLASVVWYRVMLLYFWAVLDRLLSAGYVADIDDLIAIRGNEFLRANVEGGSADPNEVDYLCRWAFNLLKTSRAAVGYDFRRFHQRFGELHRGKPGRCHTQGRHILYCNGRTTKDCGRFTDRRLVQANQSVHDESRKRHTSCPKVMWDERSYLRLAGRPRAVANYAPKSASYIEASRNTMAISHVWSHGHGGRPDQGLNECLHQRFSQLAAERGCDSYWIDTLCIPDAPELRQEAIRFINRTFETSRAVLVLDKDLMDFDPGRCDKVADLPIRDVERLLATFLVCDWNVRAWTMLEAMKGCRSLYLLCKHNTVFSLLDLIRRLHGEGDVSLAILFLSAHHLIPQPVGGGGHATTTSSSPQRSLEAAGSVLSYRHATREGDDMVIWGLMTNTPPVSDAQLFWQRLAGTRVNTGFLMSTAPRLEGVRYLSWAPRTPYVRTADDMVAEPPAHDGSGSERALITARGLVGDWLSWTVLSEGEARRSTTQSRYYQELYQDGSNEGLIFARRFLHERDSLGRARCVRVIRTLASGGQSGGKEPYMGLPGRNSDRGELFAVITRSSSENGECWSWRGVHYWPTHKGVLWPPMERIRFTIV